MVLLLNAAATPEIYTLSLHDALPISRRRPQLLLRPLGARDRGDLQRGEVPHSPRRVLGEEASRGPEDPRRSPGDLQQVVHPDDEHLRAPGVAEEPALPEVQAQAPRQRRGPP